MGAGEGEDGEGTAVLLRCHWRRRMHRQRTALLLAIHSHLANLLVTLRRWVAQRAAHAQLPHPHAVVHEPQVAQRHTSDRHLPLHPQQRHLAPAAVECNRGEDLAAVGAHVLEHHSLRLVRHRVRDGARVQVQLHQHAIPLVHTATLALLGTPLVVALAVVRAIHPQLRRVVVAGVGHWLDGCTKAGGLRVGVLVQLELPQRAPRTEPAVHQAMRVAACCAMDATVAVVVRDPRAVLGRVKGGVNLRQTHATRHSTALGSFLLLAHQLFLLAQAGRRQRTQVRVRAFH
mmetsp:Transcript_22745/g.73176  ORF Transcript_22745/g.73176 Transcript_22745/m.73176 type:complete len:288 (+) Transcript_22745:1416-2279(+)